MFSRTPKVYVLLFSLFLKFPPLLFPLSSSHKHLNIYSGIFIVWQLLISPFLGSFAFAKPLNFNIPGNLSWVIHFPHFPDPSHWISWLLIHIFILMTPKSILPALLILSLSQAHTYTLSPYLKINMLKPNAWFSLTDLFLHLCSLSYQMTPPVQLHTSNFSTWNTLCTHLALLTLNHISDLILSVFFWGNFS